MEKKPFRIGTRCSPLALAHDFETRSSLMDVHKIPPHNIVIIPLSTKGDRITNRTLTEIGGKGLFTEEIEKKLISGEIDCAVHSAKDMPTKLLKGLQISAYLPREDIRDVFISHTAQSLKDLALHSVIGTSSLRRKALLLRWRSDISVIDFRGKIETRLNKLNNNKAHAILLAYAGIKRLKKEKVIKEILNIEDFPPSPGQGAICIETHVNNPKAQELVKVINHEDTWDSVNCERAFLAELDGSCKSAIAGFAYCKGSTLYFYGIVLASDGKIFHEVSRNGNRCDAINIGRDAAQYIRFISNKNVFNF
ncbi:hydroxymethylbilane synthase [Candidatus Liberibacter asiaticus]